MRVGTASRPSSSLGFTAWRVQAMLEHPGYHGVVVERGGEVVASGWADERGPVVGIGPVTVDPGAQDAGAGRAVIEALLKREQDRAALGVRLVQSSYHVRSLALYVRLGFVVREPLSVVAGEPARVQPKRRHVRPAADLDLDAANELCRRVHGHDRAHELRDAIAAGTALVVEHEGRPSAYATGVGYGWHAVGEDDDDLRALLAAPEAYGGIGVLVPLRRASLLAWCLDQGLRIVQQNMLMTQGFYAEPAGAWFPSVQF